MNNTCGSGGGGILTFSYDGIVIDSCSFQDNTALAGAAAYIVRHLISRDFCVPLSHRIQACLWTPFTVPGLSGSPVQ